MNTPSEDITTATVKHSITYHHRRALMREAAVRLTEWTAWGRPPRRA